MADVAVNLGPKKTPWYKNHKRNLLYVAFFAVIVGGTAYAGNHKNSSPVVPPQPLTTVTATPTPLPLQGPCKATQLNSNDSESFIPDGYCTPGVTNPAVTQATIKETICVSGYTSTIRPPVSYTNKLKVEQIQQYGYADKNTRDYEEDHFISLELGGNPSDPKNLWPEPGASVNEKDKVENYLHAQVCSGSMTLQEAQKEITTNWYQVFTQQHL